MNFKTIIPLVLVFSINPAQAHTDRIGSDIVGYVEVGPGICQVEFLSDDNQIYTFTEDCSDV
jgi:hypothetical protein